MDRYYWSGSCWVPSVTTVMPSPDLEVLMKWAADCAVDYLCLDELVPDDPDKARTAYQREAAEAADYGTYIHALCELFLTAGQEIESPHELTNGFMNGFDYKTKTGLKKHAVGFYDWCKNHNVKVIATEHEVITDTYGGKLDLVCEIDSFWMTKRWCNQYGHKWYEGIDKQRVIALPDFKTGKETYYDTWKYQLAGYKQAWDKRYGQPIQHYGVLKFNKKTGKINYKDFTEYEATCPKEAGNKVNGKLETEKYTRTYETDRQTFNALVKLWWLRNRGVVI